MAQESFRVGTKLNVAITICFLAFSWSIAGLPAARVLPISHPAWVPASVSGSELLAVNATKCTWQYCNGSNAEENSGLAQQCQCDSNCWQVRNCCLDFWQPQSSESFLEALSARGRFVVWGGHATCESFVISQQLPKTWAKFMTVSSCPETTAPSVAQLCKPSGDRFLQIPVYSHDTRVTYKNLCYAACHQDATNVSFWNTTFRCNGPSVAETVADALTDKRCQLEVKPLRAPDGAQLATSCKDFRPKVVSTCNASWQVPNDSDATQQIRTLCRIVYAEVKANGRSYSNIYCALCNMADPSTVTTARCERPAATMCRSCMPGRVITLQTKTFAVLFDANFRSKGQILGVERQCPTRGQLYDPFRQQCRQIFCSEGYDYHEGQCVAQRLTTAGLGQAMVSTSRSQLELSCPKIWLDVNDSSVVVHGNGTLTIVGTSERYGSGSYEYVNGSVVICADLGQNYVSKFPGTAFECLTLVGSVLSLVALALKMAIFALLPETRSFPDRIMLSLSASLFVAQLLFTVAVTDASHYVLCAIVAVVMHYAFLATFCWMSVLAFDVWQTFSNIEVRNVHSNSKFLRYSLFAWLTPSAIVLLACVCEWGLVPLSAFSPLRPYYGQALCWISSRPALLVYFVAPVSILLFTNLLFFSATSWNICVSSRQTSMAQKSSMRNSTSAAATSPVQKAHHLHFCLYFKLAVILGLTWISGFVATYADQPPFWYFFVVLNTLQGVYILLAFTPYRKIRRCLVRHLQRPTYYGRMRDRRGLYDNGHQPLQRSSTQSSQMTNISTGSTQRTSVFSTMSAA